MIRLLSRITRIASKACRCKRLTKVFPSYNTLTIAEIRGAMFIFGENKIKYELPYKTRLHCLHVAC
jgi:hypothetical protein